MTSGDRMMARNSRPPFVRSPALQPETPSKLKNNLLSWKRLHRSVHIAVALLTVFLLVRPLNCFTSGKFDQKAVDCCKKGKCSPSNADPCCRATVPSGNQLVTAQATYHSVPVLNVVSTEIPDATLQMSITAISVQVHQPPGSPPALRSNLPLLI